MTGIVLLRDLAIANAAVLLVSVCARHLQHPLLGRSVLNTAQFVAALLVAHGHSLAFGLVSFGWFSLLGLLLWPSPGLVDRVVTAVGTSVPHRHILPPF